MIRSSPPGAASHTHAVDPRPEPAATVLRAWSALVPIMALENSGALTGAAESADVPATWA